MSGVATPPIVTQPFGADAAPPYITLPIPVAAPVTPGLASYDTGFPPINMTNPTLGGIPPSGADMNGILYTLSAWCAFEQAGQIVQYSSDVVTALSGYAVGAVVRGVTNPLQFWVNAVDGNTNDPDSNSSGWVSSIPIYSSVAPAAGTYNNVVLTSPSDLFLDVDTAAGNVTYTGFVAQRDGQKLTITNTGANLLQLSALTGSSANNQIRAPGDIGVVQNQSISIQFFAGVNKWTVV